VSEGLHIARLDTTAENFAAELALLTHWSDEVQADIETAVKEVIANVRSRGDAAVIEYTNQWDRRQVGRFEEFCVSEEQMLAALDGLGAEQESALRQAAQRIEDFHRHQLQESWQYRDEMGNLLGQKVTPMKRAGVYVPGGKAAYPSSVLMNVIPARVAGVEEIIMVSPAPGGELNLTVLAAASIAGVTRCYSIGGAQAVAALAYGTESIPRVDKIVGPGNAYVAAAKRMLFGQVGIDMIAGPSEILVIADGSVPADWVAMDLLSQAEHDEQAQAILLCADQDYIDQVARELQRALLTLERQKIARQSLASRGALIKVANLAAAVELANELAPEHLELAVKNAEELVDQIENAGAIFLGGYSPEAVGDYCAGPNHVLPTSATARFSSPLGVYDFQKRSSIIGCSAAGGSELGKIASVLARSESFTAHARSAEFRIASDVKKP
jgi:histidinol dehydrogenase